MSNSQSNAMKYHVTMQSGRDFILNSGYDVYEADWEAYEVAVVSGPADNTVGFDRGLNLGRSQSLIDNLNKEKQMSEQNKKFTEDFKTSYMIDENNSFSFSTSLISIIRDPYNSRFRFNIGSPNFSNMTDNSLAEMVISFG